jgi:DNA-directed RNA polymerase sigma subunit (sigma70/sigma32)
VSLRRDNRTMSTFVWPTDDGWPYPDSPSETVDLDGEADDDLLSLTSASGHLLDHLSTLEREVVAARFGLAGHAERSMRELVAETGVSRSEIREALGSALAKLRAQLRA